MRQAGAAVLVLAAFALGSCGGSQAVVVEMLDNRFSPVEVTVPAGDEVSFVGAGRNPHNAVAADGSWSTESVFGSLEQFDGDAADLTFDTPGTYPFFCTFHGNAEGEGMAGTLTVVPAQNAP